MMPASARARVISAAATRALSNCLIGGGSWSKHNDAAMVRMTKVAGTVGICEPYRGRLSAAGFIVPGMSLRTTIELAGNCSIVAETGQDIGRGAPTVTVYLGDTLIIRMPPDVADALADALADTAPVMWPATHEC